ncbi:MAG: Rnase Y domain-containing protein, partial [Muribaculaceae bacterium]|nr:Rnase Y domain-containing protein [Muribaculaceae bacterium]
MNTAIWILIAALAAIAGYVIASVVAKKNARSEANIIIDEARREADVIKEKNILKAKEEEMKILSDAERVAAQKVQKAQASE